jgi:hypothetical protein
MRKYWIAAAAMIGACSGVRAGTYIPVPMVPGAVSEIVFSINNHNVVAGSFRDSANVEHAFFGPLDGSNWTTFDAPFEGTTGTEARYINDHGAITGIALHPKFKVGEQFYRAPDGTFSVFEKDGQPLDGIAQGMDSTDASVGDYLSTDGRTLGYIDQSGKYKKDFKLHLHGKGKFLQISPRGVSDSSGVIVGLFVDENGTRHGFWQNQFNGVATVVDYPDSQSRTAIEDMNQQSIFTGQWKELSGDTHAFILIYGRRIVDLDPKDGSASQQAWGLNDNGLVALSTSVGHSYIFCLKKYAGSCPDGGFTLRDRTHQWPSSPPTKSYSSVQNHATPTESVHEPDGWIEGDPLNDIGRRYGMLLPGMGLDTRKGVQ